MDNNINFKKGNYGFNFRVAGYITCQDKVLLQKDLDEDHYNLIGGRVQFGETTEEALVREIEEEIGVKVKEPKLIHIAENFFGWHGLQAHEIDFVFAIELSKKYLEKFSHFHILDQEEETVWVDKKDIRKYNCQPYYIWDLHKYADKGLTRSVERDGKCKFI